jgi:hypothetical protein
MVAISEGLTLEVSGEPYPGLVTSAAIREALLGMGAGDTVILASGPETYLQTASPNGGYTLEMRKGHAQSHVNAVRGRSAASASDVSSVFTFEEVSDAYLAYTQPMICHSASNGLA